MVKKFVIAFWTITIMILSKITICYIHNYIDPDELLEKCFQICIDDYEVQSYMNTVKWKEYGGSIEVILLVDEMQKEDILSKATSLGFMYITEGQNRNSFLTLEKHDLPKRNIWCARNGTPNHLPYAKMEIQSQDEMYIIKLIYIE
ncbi:MAG: hypothetical protein Q4C48_04770 [Lachnospiraceae bacterium]|nr:hypothetical protein [Lachnospiraceae bacterium]